MPATATPSKIRAYAPPEAWTPPPENITDHVLAVAMRCQPHDVLAGNIDEAVREVEHRLSELAGLLHSQADPTLASMLSIFGQVERMVTRRRGLLTLKGRLSVLAGNGPLELGPPDHEMIDGLLGSHPEFYKLCDALIRSVRERQAAAHQRLTASVELAVENNRGGNLSLAYYGPGCEALLRNLAVAVEYGECSDRLDLLLEAEGATDRLRAERVAAIIEAAGGIEAVVRMCRGARIVTGSWLELCDRAAELARLRAEAVAADERFAVARSTGLAALQDEAKKAADAAKKALTKAEGEADATLRADQEAVIRRAVQGDEHSRACLESLARGVNGAFPGGFASQLAAAVVDRPSPVEMVLRIRTWNVEL